jgi:hypothetical protein
VTSLGGAAGLADTTSLYEPNFKSGDGDHTIGEAMAVIRKFAR